MWNPILLQACLRLESNNIPKKLEIWKKYNFQKDNHRLYQINVPMDLRLSNWDFICRIIVTHITIWDGITKWVYIPVKLFSDDDKKTITKCFVSDEEVNDIV